MYLAYGILLALLAIAGSIIYLARQVILPVIKADVSTATGAVGTDVKKIDADVLARLHELEQWGKLEAGTVAAYVKAHL